jgi:DNA polymerase I
MTKRLVLIDGNSLLHRAYHGYPLLRTGDGELVNAVFGFTAMLLKVLGQLQPTHVAVAWDVKGKTFRHKMYKEYKAGRAKTDQELLDQVDRTKEVVMNLNIPQFGVEGYEADDIIGTLAEQALEKEKTEDTKEVVIVTGDRDALQLVKGESVKVHMPSRGRGGNGGSQLFDEVAVESKYGLSPKQLVDLKGLMGDSSDNIKGVKGIGQVIGTRLIKQGETLEGVYENLDNLDVSDRVKSLLRKEKEEAFRSKSLGTIECAMPIDLEWDRCELHDYDRKKIEKLFLKLEFRSLLGKLPEDKWDKEAEEVFV